MNLPHHLLVVWQRADDLFIELHKLSLKTFPAFERFELGSQTRRAAYSVAANIVEGAARTHKGEKLQFLNNIAIVARGGWILPARRAPIGLHQR